MGLWRLRYWIIGIIVGLGMIIGGIHMLTESNVDCGGQQMSSGERCISFGSGDSTTRSLRDQRSHDHRQGGLFLGFGILLLGGCSCFLYAETAGRRRSEQQRAQRRAPQGTQQGPQQGQWGPGQVWQGPQQGARQGVEQRRWDPQQGQWVPR